MTDMTIKDAIKIRVDSHYLQEQSDPASRHYVFAYTVQITNAGTEPVKLLNRHWRIQDDNNKVEEVIGEGVVGQQPEIYPGQSFHYTSGTVLGTEMGTMSGSYEMVTADGLHFKAAIPPFLLATPHTVH